MGKQWKQWQILFSWAPKSLQVAIAAMKLEDACSLNIPGGSEVKASICLQCRRPGFIPWVGKIPWRRKWQATPVFLPGKSHGGRSLVGYSPRGHRVGHDWATSFSLSLLLGRQAMTNLDSVLKSRDIILPAKVHIVKAMVFPVVMYGCESWTIKKSEHWRIDAFELWCWRRLLRVPWTAMRSNQSILKEINPE